MGPRPVNKAKDKCDTGRVWVEVRENGFDASVLHASIRTRSSEDGPADSVDSSLPDHLY